MSLAAVARRLETDASTVYRWGEGTSLPRGENYAGLIRLHDEVMNTSLPKPKKLADNDRDNAILNLHRLGQSGAEIGRVLNISRERVRQILAKHGAKD